MNSALNIRLWCILSTILLSVAVFGEDSAEDSLSVNELIAKVEKEYAVVFYYDPVFLDTSLTSVFKSTNELEIALNNYFSAIGVQVTLLGKSVFLTKRSPRVQAFPATFFDPNRSPDSSYFQGGSVPEPTELINPEFETISFGTYSKYKKGNSYTITGQVNAKDTGEPVVGVTVRIANSSTGVITDENGRYSVLVPAGDQRLLFQTVGMRETSRTLQVYENGELDVDMLNKITELGEVIITGQVDEQVKVMALGLESLDADQLNKIPMVLGEADILRAILTFPGIQTVGEVSNGFHVRGGGIDQNLILLDDAPIINSSHFFGFFSVFNADMVGETQLFKGLIPPTYGGRLSSVLDVKTRNGNMEHFTGSVGVSPVTGRAHVEGPLIKDRVSVALGARSTYSDWLLNQVKDVRIKNSDASFYDIHGKIHAVLGDRSGLDITAYRSSDYFVFDGISSNRYVNNAAAISFYSALNQEFFYESSVNYSRYRFNVVNISNRAIASDFLFSINQIGTKQQLSWKKSRFLDLVFGVESRYYWVNPGAIQPYGEGSQIQKTILNREQGLELALFLQNEHQIGARWEVSYGVRFSNYFNFGPKNVRTYIDNASKNDQTVVDTIQFNAGETVQFYAGFEPRLLVKYETGPLTSIKGGYSRMYQYINLISNNVSPAPTDIWKLSDTHFLPQYSDQFSVGFFKDFVNSKRKLFTASVEGYTKFIHNTIDYKVGADLVLNESLETQIVVGKGFTYGVELQLQMDSGPLNGWVNYTFSRAKNVFSNLHIRSNEINEGDPFPANHDKPHAFKAILNYDFFRRLRTSVSMNYATGRPFTIPTTTFELGGLRRVQYGDRNQARLPDYFRTDLAVTLEGNIKKKKLIYDSYSLSIVNITGRNNPYSVFFQNDSNGRIRAYTLSIFAKPVITLTANFNF